MVTGQSTGLFKAVELDSTNPSHELSRDEDGTTAKVLLRAR
jgi:hypothetical protein